MLFNSLPGIALPGLWLEGERKSIEPPAQRVPGGNEQALQQLVNQSPWAHEPIQEKLSRRLVRRSGQGKGVLVLDDTTLPEKGGASVGAARQYCGAVGKGTNCQAVVTWHDWGPRVHCPSLGEVYLPQSWITDPAQLDRVGVPEDERGFREKWRLAAEVLDRVSAALSYEAIVMDAGDGGLRAFLHALDQRGQCFVAQIPESHCFWPATIACFPLTADPKAQPLSAKARRAQAEAGTLRWRKVTLRLQPPKTVEVARVRVRETISQAWRRPGPERWLLIERRGDGKCKYYLSNAPLRTSVRQMLNWAHQRWKREQSY